MPSKIFVHYCPCLLFCHFNSLFSAMFALFAIFKYRRKQGCVLIAFFLEFNRYLLFEGHFSFLFFFCIFCSLARMRSNEKTSSEQILKLKKKETIAAAGWKRRKPYSRNTNKRNRQVGFSWTVKNKYIGFIFLTTYRLYSLALKNKLG